MAGPILLLNPKGPAVELPQNSRAPRLPLLGLSAEVRDLNGNLMLVSNPIYIDSPYTEEEPCFDRFARSRP
jgi:hypothetical protein